MSNTYNHINIVFVIEPSPPKNVTATSNSKGIMVSWTCPDYPTPDKIQCYKLVMTYLKDEEQTKDSIPNKNGDGSMLMSSVSSKTEYTFAITTVVKAETSLGGVGLLPHINESRPSEISVCYSSDNVIKEAFKRIKNKATLLLPGS